MGLDPIGLVSSKGRKLRHSHAQREDPVRTQGEGGPVQAKERGLQGNYLPTP